MSGMKLFQSFTSKLIPNKNMSEDIRDHHETNNFRITNDDDGKTSLYDKSVDVFAFGIMMYEIGFLRRIYENMELMTIYNLVTEMGG